jgi:hypothetical protein
MQAKASKAIDDANRLADGSVSLPLQITVLLAEAEVRASAQEIPKALQLMESARDKADRGQLFALGLEARLKLGRTELCCGDHRRGVELLTAVEGSARERGYNRVGKQAEQSLANPAQVPTTTRNPT